MAKEIVSYFSMFKKPVADQEQDAEAKKLEEDTATALVEKQRLEEEAEKQR